VNHQVIEFHGFCIVDHEVHHLSPDARTSKLGLHVHALEHARTSHKSSGPGNAINHEEPGAADGHVIEEREIAEMRVAVICVPGEKLKLEGVESSSALPFFVDPPLIAKSDEGRKVLVLCADNSRMYGHPQTLGRSASTPPTCDRSPYTRLIMDLITTPFGFTSTASEVVAGLDLSAQRVVITGAASGIGVETARALASVGAEVTLAVRDVKAGERVASEIAAGTGNDRVQAAWLDLTDHDSIRAFTTSWSGSLHVLINNAGIMAVPELELSFEGHELQFATNHLGHFALTTALHRSLAAASGARVVCVSSSAHQISDVIFEDIDYESRPYDPWTAYGQSKTANVLHAVEITKRWCDEGIVANALNPGAIPTNLQRHTGGLKTPEDRRKTPEQGAATSALLAASPLVAGVGGRYFENCNEAPIVTEFVQFGGGVAAYALNPEKAERLWDRSLALLDWS
jgi:NAD(P)-dependent dehydrogenase (short-subunit alcohol dehydrogenase family)